jgi:glutaredoxin
MAAHWAPAFAAISSAVKVSAFKNHQMRAFQAISLKFAYRGTLDAPAHQQLCSRRGVATTTAAGDGTTAGSFKLIVYSKEDCPLCDKLKEKLEAIIDRSTFMPSILSGVELEIRDVSTNPAWKGAYSMSVPVLAVASLDGSHEVCTKQFVNTLNLKS